MPRNVSAEVESPDSVERPEDSGTVDANEATSGNEAPKRRGRPARSELPAGVTVGLLSEPEPAELPGRSGRGRTVSNETKSHIAKLVASPGQAFKIGVFRTASMADGAWKEAGITFHNYRNEQGLYDRYAVYNAPESQG